MKVDIEGMTVNLDRLQIIKLRRARGVRLYCSSGSLWVTQENIPRDDFLQPGASQEIESDGIVVIEALAASSLSMDSHKRSGAKTATRQGHSTI